MLNHYVWLYKCYTSFHLYNFIHEIEHIIYCLKRLLIAVTGGYCDCRECVPNFPPSEMVTIIMPNFNFKKIQVAVRNKKINTSFKWSGTAKLGIFIMMK